MNWLFRFLFHLSGWKVVGQIPTVKKSIFVVAPHATWIDFPLGICTRAALRVRISFLGKRELFDGPFGFIFRNLNGYPVDRSNRTNFVQSVVDLYNSHEELHLAIAPEGTRPDVAKLRTGFYYMAHNAKVPMNLIGFEYPTKSIIINEPFYTTGNMEEDLKYIATYYSKIKGVQKTWIKNYLEGSF